MDSKLGRMLVGEASPGRSGHLEASRVKVEGVAYWACGLLFYTHTHPLLLPRPTNRL